MASPSPRPTADDVTPSYNEVRLRGRLAGDLVERTLPSGDPVVSFRIVVQREPGPRRRAPVDALDCSAYRADVRRKLLRWSVGDIVEVQGRLRRRFSRSTGVPISRYDVEVTSARRATWGDRPP